MPAPFADLPRAPGDLEATEPSALAMRRAMGAFGTGVTVVSALDEGEPVGFACQAFASVSLDPPLVLFCADHRGRSWSRIRRVGRFTVNVLGEHQHDVCARFGSSVGARFADLDWTLSRWDTPALPGVLMRAHCDVETVHRTGDHDIVVGRVLELETRDEGRPLVFFRGRFGLEAQPETPAWAWTHGWDWGS
ncbi:flavin reductase family protein [Nocardioides sp. YIM 152315]|uniref:flavin reductase family protein n=1 Tax=Nocardioides sp. YIM 152315 TaxID=3031760 RepID=UPI0023DBE5BC|nr:flavin reductase family protein [Nocardioides sp. YIM 152315]MDF1604669.1 flavin reductase family protein [Nocardioides sp. YIM 152315]